MTNNLLDHLRPLTLAKCIAEIIADHADEDPDFGEFTFHTEDAKNAYSDLLAAGIRNFGETRFFHMIEIAVDRELDNQDVPS